MVSFGIYVYVTFFCLASTKVTSLRLEGVGHYIGPLALLRLCCLSLCWFSFTVNVFWFYVLQLVKLVSDEVSQVLMKLVITIYWEKG